MARKFARILLATLVAVALGGIMACGESGPAEQAAEKMGDAVSEVGEAAEEMGEAAEEMGEAAKEILETEEEEGQ